jgi:hypothetical protein
LYDIKITKKIQTKDNLETKKHMRTVDKSVDKLWITFLKKNTSLGKESYPQFIHRLIHRLSYCKERRIGAFDCEKCAL